MASLVPLMAAFLPLFFFLYFIVFGSKKHHPPGPKGLPILGNMLMLDQSTLTYNNLAKLARKYGDVCRMRMGSVNIVIISSPVVAKQALQVQDHVFANRPPTKATTYLSYNRSDLAFADYGPFWRQMRKLCVMRLFSRKRAESWESVRDEVNFLVKAVAANTGKPVNIGEMIFGLVVKITFRAAFGSKAEGQEEFLKILQQFNDLFIVFNISDFIPWLRWFDTVGLDEKLANARRGLDIFIDQIIDDHMSKKGENNSCDMVDELLSFYGSEAKVTEADDLQSSIRITRDNIKAIIMDVMFGGIETVASVIEWALTELIANPDYMKKVQQEMTDVVGLDRCAEETDFENLKFLKATLKETLRLHPPIPVIHHETTEDTEVCGYYIPAKTRVMVNVWDMMRNPNFYEDPEKFNPTRFLKPDAPNLKGSHFEFLPFGAGRRSCPGMNFGLYGLEMTITHLIHCFHWELPDGMKPNELDMSNGFGLSLQRANRLVAIPSARLSCSLV